SAKSPVASSALTARPANTSPACLPRRPDRLSSGRGGAEEGDGLDRLPPRIVRRLVLAPLAFMLCLALIAVSPLLLLAAAIADLFLAGSWLTLRLLAFIVWYF